MTLTRRSPPLDQKASPDGARPAPSTLVPSRLAQRLRWLGRIAAAAAWTIPCAAIQAPLIARPGRGKRVVARLYWAGICRVLGIQRRVLGQRVPPGARPVVFASNHTSWLDVPALGGTLEACFVAKAEVGRWPVVRTIAYLGRTVFVSRRPSETGRERDTMRDRLTAGDDLILFPEGTSSDGARVLAFRSPFFAVAEPRLGATLPLIQPVSVVFDQLDFLPARRTTRPVSSWYGDMDLGGHFWRLAAHKQLRATILLHPPVDPADYASRKALAQAVWTTVAAGAALLRQNRPLPAATVATADSLDRATPGIGTVETA